MSRYIVKPRAFYTGIDEYGDVSITADTVLCDEDYSPERTGLLNAEGRPLYRVREKHKMGFDI